MQRFALASLTALVAMAGGCARQRFMTLEREARGLVVVLPGVEGRGPLNRAICDGLNLGRVDWGIKLEDWTAPFGPIYNLRAEDHNRRKAAEISVKLAEYKYAHPNNPVVLVGHSGGGAMALWIAESMPPNQDLDGVILLSPAISPPYLVDFALSRTRRGVISFYSHRDWVFLGLGTTISGTMDGHHTSSAGRVGFVIPSTPHRSKHYSKLYQIAWHERMAEMGHKGGHFSSSAEAFVAAYVAPFVLAGQWNDEVVADVLSRRPPRTTAPPVELPSPAPSRTRPAPRPAAAVTRPATRPLGPAVQVRDVP